ncbi:MAG: hypothetical protein ACLFRD_04685 [Nitriliruptoraceae bacterium]
MATTTAKSTAKSTAKKTAKKTAAKSTAKKTAKQTAAKQSATSPRREREPVELLEITGYALAGVGKDVVGAVRRLPEQVESLRSEDAVAKLRERLATDAKRYLGTVEQLLERKAADGRQAIGEVTSDERVAKVLDQTAATRSQLKAALTSVTRTGTVAAEAASKQAGTAKSQVKAAATSVRKSADTLTEAVTED